MCYGKVFIMNECPNVLTTAIYMSFLKPRLGQASEEEKRGNFKLNTLTKCSFLLKIKRTGPKQIFLKIQKINSLIIDLNNNNSQDAGGQNKKTGEPVFTLITGHGKFRLLRQL